MRKHRLEVRQHWGACGSDGVEERCNSEAADANLDVFTLMKSPVLLDQNPDIRAHRNGH